MNNLKNINWPIVMALFVPFLMVVIVSASVYLPRLYVKPQYNFVYISGMTKYEAENSYEVVSGKIKRIEGETMLSTGHEGGGTLSIDRLPVEPMDFKYDMSQRNEKFYIYDTTTHTNRKVDYAEIIQIPLQGAQSSPDGFRVERGMGRGSFLFGGTNNYDTWYLKNKSVIYQLPSIDSGSMNDIHVFGWIKKSV